MTAIAGGMHLGIGLHHGLLDAHGLGLLAIGATQAGIGWLLHHRPSRARLTATVLVNTSVAAAWLFTYVATAAGHGAITPAGLIATTVEAIAVLLALAARRRPIPAPHSNVRVVALAGAVVVATAAFGATGHSHHHDLPSRTTASAETTKPMFGDLFADHHHDPPATDHDGPTERPHHSEPHDH